jgi:hypothetical protein
VSDALWSCRLMCLVRGATALGGSSSASSG